MKEDIQNSIQKRLHNWLMRKAPNSAVREVSDLSAVIGSDIGVARSDNQDRVAILRMAPSKDCFFAVAALCDGMGGMSEGSICASQAIASFFMACIRNRHVLPTQRVIIAAQDANRHVHSLFNGRGGATLSAVLFDSIAGVAGVNVGDSRIYSYQGNKLEQVTVDDTMAGLLKDNFNQSNELLQYIGMGTGLEPHVIQLPASFKSIIMTSDGAHFIDKQVMQMVVQASNNSELTVRRLIEIAKWCGGNDNASIISVSQLSLRSELPDDPGTIQVYDPFGELQLIVFDIAGTGKTDNHPTPEKKTFQAEKPQKSKESIKDVKKEKAIKKGKTTNKIVPKRKNAEVKETIPQLNIYFNGETGKDNNG